MNIDDPRLTAYALDECEHLEAADRAEIEKALAMDAKLSAEIAELRRLTENLREELRAEKGEALTPEQRAEVLTTLNGNGNGRVIIPARHRWWRSQMIGLAVAACVVIGLSATVYYQGEHVRRLEVERERLLERKPTDEAGVAVQLGEFAERESDVAAAIITAPQVPQLAIADATTSLAIGQIRESVREQKNGASNAPASAPVTWAAQGVGVEALSGTLKQQDLSLGLQPTPRAAAATSLDGFGGRGDLAVSGGAPLPTDASALVPAQSAAGTVTLKPASPAKRSTAARAMSTRGLTLADGTADYYAEGVSKLGEVDFGNKDAASKLRADPKADGYDKTLYSRGRGGEEARKSEAEKLMLADEVADVSSLSTASEAVQLRRQLTEAEKQLQERSETTLAKNTTLEKLRDAPTPQARPPGSDVEFEFLGRRVEELRQRIQQQQDGESNTEAYDSIKDNPFLGVIENPLSTFSIDVDTASYSNVRRFLNSNQRPPKGAVRVEELVNYFRYDYPQPKEKDPFGATLEVATSPWAPEHRLVRIGIKGREIPRNERPAANLVFLVDVSGSMQPENKLPLVKECLRLLTDQLAADDSVSIAVYAGASGCVLEPTHDKEKVRTALARLESGGSTNGAAGIQLAYDLAQRAFKKGGSNRVILCTDGDFNVGTTDQSQLVSMIEGKAKTGVFLSVLGFGYGNLKDSTLEKLADKGNGNYGYIDSIAEGRRLFVEQLAGTLCTIAKDVKIQVEFNPAQVSSYRLIGYENRLLAKEDFNDDTKDAGEIGAGHTATALYEVVPAGQVAPAVVPVDELKYQPIKAKRDLSVTEPESSKELLTVKIRYKQPDGDTSTKLEFPLRDDGLTWEKSSRDFRWAAAVAGFGMMLRDSPHKGSLSWSLVEELTAEGRSENSNAERAEFVQLVDKARALSR